METSITDRPGALYGWSYKIRHVYAGRLALAATISVLAGLTTLAGAHRGEIAPRPDFELRDVNGDGLEDRVFGTDTEKPRIMYGVRISDKLTIYLPKESLPRRQYSPH